MRVLSVDDQPNNRYFLESVFQAMGHEVISAANGQEGLQRLEGRAFDLIISDIFMPQMDGFQFCRAVRNQSRFDDVAFVFYTSTYTERKDQEFGLSLGADRYILKPEEPTQLLAIADDVVKERKAGKRGQTPVPRESEEAYLKLYSTRLVEKLEQKVAALEQTTRELQSALAAKDEEMNRRLRLEEELRQAQKMEAVGLLAGGVAHDFNNILQSVLGQVELLSHGGRLDEEGRESTALIEAAVRRGTAMINRLLTFSRRRPTSRQSVDARALIGEFGALMGSLLGPRYPLRLDLGETSLPLHVDVGMVEQALMNLVVNARDAMEAGGGVWVGARKVSVGADHVAAHPGAVQGEFVRIHVRDEGCGIDPKLIPRVFEPFFTTKPVGKGTGLGLSTVHSVAQAHGGWVELESVVGKGTSFALYLPYGTSEGKVPTEEKGLFSEAVLLVEMDDASRESLTRYLRGLGYVVLETRDIASAQEAWKRYEGRIQALVFDLSASNCAAGKEFVKGLKRQVPDLRVLCIHCCESEFEAVADVFMLPRPIAPEVLAQTLRNVLDAG